LERLKTGCQKGEGGGNRRFGGEPEALLENVWKMADFVPTRVKHSSMGEFGGKNMKLGRRTKLA
jgi:hypothetical protein